MRRLTEPDATRTYADWFRAAEVRRCSAHATPTIAECRTYIRKALSNPDIMLWGIFADGRHVGNIKAERLPDQAIIGLLVDSRWRGQGVGPTAIRQAARWCFRHWKVGVVTAGVHPFNTRGMRAFEKAGFKVADLNLPRVWLHLEKP